MSGLVSKAPFGRLLGGAGGAGPRRLLLLGGSAALALGAATAVVLTGSSREQAANLARLPRTDPLPGGPRTTPEYSRLAVQHDQELAARAAAVGQSSVASMPGSAAATPTPREPAPVPTPRADPPRAVPAEVGAAPQPVPAMRQQVVPQPQTLAQPAAAAQHRQQDDAQGKAYQAAIAQVLAGWGSKAQATEVVLRPEDEQRASGNGPAGGRGGSPAATLQNAAAQEPVPNAPRLDRPGGRVLMPAGRGVYGRTVVGASSDQGGPVVVEALSGPVAGSRMTGTFERREDRLVVRLDSMSLPDGTQQRIEALVIAPDSMETSVASSVDHHYGERFVLPVAAAFVAGLGQAIAQSNTTATVSPFGSVTGFSRLNLGQQAGVGAGVAGAQLGQILKDSAPKGPTVRLDAGVNVGVLFLVPVMAPDAR